MINLKTKNEIEIMREGGMVLAKIIKELESAVRPGITTSDLDKLASELVVKFGVKSSFLGYDGYPAVLCTSINEEIVHGVPSDRKLVEGDLLKIDMGVIHGGFHTDSAVTVLVSDKSKLTHILKQEYSRKLRLMSVTKNALEVGIKQAKIGNTLGDIGSAIQKYVERERLGVVRDLVGHGVGRDLHEAPQVPNYGRAGYGEKLVEGMVIAIEPMVVTGDYAIKDGADGFTFETKDGGLAAHFEHTIAITAEGPKILTVV